LSDRCDVEYIRDGRKAFPPEPVDSAARSLKIWHCKFKSLSGLNVLSQLERLVIGTCSDSSLEPIGGLTRLRDSRILHFPRVDDLGPPGNLQSLERPTLEASPGWDSPGKTQPVASLLPLSKLPDLTEPALFGVRPADGSLRDLEHQSAKPWAIVAGQ
jgi:hypothetical protein